MDYFVLAVFLLCPEIWAWVLFAIPPDPFVNSLFKGLVAEACSSRHVFRASSILKGTFFDWLNDRLKKP